MSDKAITFLGAAFFTVIASQGWLGFTQINIESESSLAVVTVYFVVFSFWFGFLMLVGEVVDLGKAFSKMIWSKFS